MDRTTRNFAVVTMLALLSLAVCNACAGAAARKNVLLPVMVSAWERVGPQVTVGINDGLATQRLTQTTGDELHAQVTTMGAALKDNDAALASALWPRLRVEGEIGINVRQLRGDISPPAAESLRERMRQFTEAVQTLTEGG